MKTALLEFAFSIAAALVFLFFDNHNIAMASIAVAFVAVQSSYFRRNE